MGPANVLLLSVDICPKCESIDCEMVGGIIEPTFWMIQRLVSKRVSSVFPDRKLNMVVLVR